MSNTKADTKPDRTLNRVACGTELTLKIAAARKHRPTWERVRPEFVNCIHEIPKALNQLWRQFERKGFRENYFHPFSLVILPQVSKCLATYHRHHAQVRRDKKGTFFETLFFSGKIVCSARSLPLLSKWDRVAPCHEKGGKPTTPILPYSVQTASRKRCKNGSYIVL